MTIDDEPVLRRHMDDSGEDQETIKARIKRLVVSQPYAVLCTQGDGQPYGSLVAFAFSEDLTTVVFATPVATRKYRLLAECKQVALLVDNRPDFVNDMMQVEAVTATGRATEIARGSERERHAELLLERHPYLKAFVASETSALFQIRTTRFLHVTRFQEVNQWVPGKP